MKISYNTSISTKSLDVCHRGLKSFIYSLERGLIDNYILHDLIKNSTLLEDLKSYVHNSNVHSKEYKDVNSVVKYINLQINRNYIILSLSDKTEFVDLEKVLDTIFDNSKP